MPPLATAARTGANASRRATLRRLKVVDGVVAALIVAYACSVVVRHGSYATAVDDWIVAGFEGVVALACIAQGLRRQPLRHVALLFGAGIAAWCVGDIFLGLESLGGATPAAVSLKDLFHLCFYPLACAAVVAFARRQVRALTPANWLDASVAGLGGAALLAALALHGAHYWSPRGALTGAMGVVYPIGALALFGLVVGTTALLPGRRTLPWVLTIVGCAVTSVGAPFNLVSGLFGSSRGATAVDEIAWPVALLLIATAVWLWPRAEALLTEKPTELVLPGLAAVAGLAILFSGTLRHVAAVALVLASVTLVVADVRLAFLLRRMRALTAQRHQQSLTDELTGLPNRRYLNQVLDEFFAAEEGATVKRLAFLFIDLNHFKEVNDSFGHAAGDQLLSLLGPRLSSCVRRSDLLVRLGGDEFGAVLVDADSRYAKSVAERIVSSLESPLAVDAVRAAVSASIGIALAPAHGKDRQSLLRCADLAMYRSKLLGAPYVLYNPRLEDDGDLRFVEELREAVAERRFELHYQPQLDLREGTVSALEVLARWPHGQLGYVPPPQFLPFVEKAGLTTALTELVIDGALAQCAAWRSGGEAVRVSVNVTSSDLRGEGFVALVRELLSRHRLPPEALSLEIAEEALNADAERLTAAIAELAEAGVETAVDDFAAGLSSLGGLATTPVSELKLDRHLLKGLEEAPESRQAALVRSLVALGHAVGLRVAAKGVEDAVTLALLADLGCDLAQGDAVSAPKSAHKLDFSKWHQPVASMVAGGAVAEVP